MTKKIEWVEAKCPECGEKYSYVKGGYKPSTCSNFTCLYLYLHRSQLKNKGGDKSKQEELASG